MREPGPRARASELRQGLGTGGEGYFRGCERSVSRPPSRADRPGRDRARDRRPPPQALRVRAAATATGKRRARRGLRRRLRQRRARRAGAARRRRRPRRGGDRVRARRATRAPNVEFREGDVQRARARRRRRSTSSARSRRSSTSPTASAYLAEMRRVLRAGGAFLVSTPRAERDRPRARRTRSTSVELAPRRLRGAAPRRASREVELLRSAAAADATSSRCSSALDVLGLRRRLTVPAPGVAARSARRRWPRSASEGDRDRARRARRARPSSSRSAGEDRPRPDRRRGRGRAGRRAPARTGARGRAATRSSSSCRRRGRSPSWPSARASRRTSPT